MKCNQTDEPNATNKRNSHATLGHVAWILFFVLLSGLGKARSSVAIVPTQTPEHRRVEFQAELLRSGLQNDEFRAYFEIVSRSNLNEIVSELERSSDGLIDFSTASVEIPIKPADYLIFAEFWADAGEINLRLADVGEQRTVAFASCALDQQANAELGTCVDSAIAALISTFVERLDMVKVPLMSKQRDPKGELDLFDAEYNGPREAVALIYFETRWPWDEQIRGKLTTELLEHPYSRKRFRVIDRQNISLTTRAVLANEVETSAFFGRMLGADFLLYVQAEGTLQTPRIISARLVDTRTSRLYATAQCTPASKLSDCPAKVVNTIMKMFAEP